MSREKSGGLGKFLFGGLLGALIGFLISPKRAQRVRDALFGGETEGRRAIRAPASRATVAEKPVAGAEPLLEESIGVAEELPVLEEGGFDYTVIAEEPVASADLRDGVESEEPVAAEQGSPFAPEKTEEEEPPRVVDDYRATNMIPLDATDEPVATNVEPYAAAVEADVAAGLETATEPDLAPDAEAAATAETVEAPGIAGWEPVAVETYPMAESPEVETAEAEPSAPESESVVIAAPESEAMALVEHETSPEPEPVEAAAPVAPADLKARIEETRRRIQLELERPFVHEPDVPVAVEQTEPEASPVHTGPSLVDPSSPVVGEALSISVSPPAGAADAAGAGEPSAVVDRMLEAEESDETTTPVEPAFDQDSMRRRIEETRNRLKAKAFDAMMGGETALLGRERETPKGGAQATVQVDEEVDETIESTLTEEDF